MRDEPGADNWKLIHGWVNHFEGPHAFIEIDGGATVYDPILNETMPAPEYDAKFPQRSICANYTRAEALEQVRRTGHFVDFH